jgi:hypothetical protein
MAKLPALISAMVSVDGRDREAIDHIGRTIREGGYIPTGKRGGGAAEMTAKEAANLILGLYGADGAKDAGLAIDRFRSLQQFAELGKFKWGSEQRERYETYPEPIQDVMDAPTFGEALEALVSGVPMLCASLQKWAEETYDSFETLEKFLLGVSAGLFGLDVELRRYGASIEMFRFNGSQREIEFQAKFRQDNERFERGFYGSYLERADKRVVVTFGLKTLIAAWRALNSESEALEIAAPESA